MECFRMTCACGKSLKNRMNQLRGDNSGFLICWERPEGEMTCVLHVHVAIHQLYFINLLLWKWNHKTKSHKCSKMINSSGKQLYLNVCNWCHLWKTRKYWQKPNVPSYLKFALSTSDRRAKTNFETIYWKQLLCTGVAAILIKYSYANGGIKDYALIAKYFFCLLLKAGINKIIKHLLYPMIFYYYTLHVKFIFFISTKYIICSYNHFIWGFKHMERIRTQLIRLLLHHWPLIMSQTSQFWDHSHSHARDRRPAGLHQPPQCPPHREDPLRLVQQTAKVTMVENSC